MEQWVSRIILSYRDWLDGTEEGVILVAFGSVSDSSVEVSMYVDRNTGLAAVTVTNGCTVAH